MLQRPDSFGQSSFIGKGQCILFSMHQAIEVPETLLKKRKQNEKAREERLVAAAAARKVSLVYVPILLLYNM